MGDAEYSAVIVLLLVVVAGLAVTVVYLYRIIKNTLLNITERLDDIDLEIHFATDNYLINERKKQRDADSANAAGG